MSEEAAATRGEVLDSTGLVPRHGKPFSLIICASGVGRATTGKPALLKVRGSMIVLSAQFLEARFQLCQGMPGTPEDAAR